MSLKDWVTFDRVKKLAGATVLATGGFFFHDVIDFRNKQNDATVAVVDSVKQANDDVTKLMLRFDQLALHGTPVSAADRQAFNEAIVKAYAASARLKNHVPSIDLDVEDYESALIGLKQGAENLQGPETGRAYTEAVSKYLVDQDRLEKSVAENRRSYLRTFVFNRL